MQTVLLVLVILVSLLVTLLLSFISTVPFFIMGSLLKEKFNVIIKIITMLICMCFYLFMAYIYNSIFELGKAPILLPFIPWIVYIWVFIKKH